MIISRSNECPYCGEDHTNSCYIVYDNGDYCFSCGGGTKKEASFYAYKPRLDLTTKSEAYIPEYTFNTKEFSTTVLKWLYDYYLDDKDIREAQIAYCAPDNKGQESIIFPTNFEEHCVKEFQRRFFPKGFYSTKGVKQHVYEARRDEQNNSVVLVEDYISARRVAKQMNAICLFGTKLTPVIVQHLLNTYQDVRIWLDPDKPGQDSAKIILKTLTTQYTNQMRSYPLKLNTEVNITNIVSTKQPKELTPSQLASYL